MKNKIFKISLFSFATVLMLLLIFLMLWKNNIFVLKAVRIYNNHFVTKEEILKKAGFDYSENIFKIDIGKIERQILEHPMIEKVKVSRFYPSILKIRVKEYDVIAGVAGSKIAAVTYNYHLVYNYNPEVLYDLPVITGIHFNKDSSGVRIPLNPELMEKAVKVLRVIKNKDPFLFNEISELNFSQDKGMLFYLKKNNIAVMFGEEHLSRKLNYFSTILNILIEKNSLNSVLALDIRYEAQVVVKRK